MHDNIRLSNPTISRQEASPNLRAAMSEASTFRIPHSNRNSTFTVDFSRAVRFNQSMGAADCRMEFGRPPPVMHDAYPSTVSNRCSDLE